MKIFFITSKLNFRTAGGSVEEFDLMIRTLIKLGNEVTAVTVFSYANDIPNPLPYRLIEENITARGLFGIQKGIFKILRKYSGQADFFHVDGHNFLYGAGLYRLFGGRVPISAFFNRELSSWPENISSLFGIKKDSFLIRLKKKLRWQIEKYFLMPVASRLDIILYTNPVLKEAYENFGMRKDPQALVIGDPIDYQKIFKENHILPDGYLKRNKKQAPITIFYSSRMAPGKGFDLLLTAFSKLKHKGNFRLILGGTGPEESKIRKMVHKFKLEPYIQMPGWVTRERLLQQHKEADIFVQAHWRTDNTSISLSYAMAFGLPSILPGGGGLEWVAKKSALYFKDEDTDDLAAKIEQLGSSPQLRAELSRNCYKRLAEEEMDYQKQISRLYKRMQQLTPSIPYSRTLTDRLISACKAVFYFCTEPFFLRLARFRYGYLYKDNEESPLITIMMPTYHRGQLLIDRTLPSIFSQTYKNFEVVIVGNYGTDNTKELLAKINDPRIRYYEMPSYAKYPKNIKARWHAGGSPERNKGLELARGKWIAEMDDDDVLTPDHLEVLLRFAQGGNYEFVSAAYMARKYGKDILVDVKDAQPRIGGIETWLYRSYLRIFKYNIDCWRKSYNRPQEIDRQLRMYNSGARIGFLEKVVTHVLPLPGAETVGLDALEIRTGEKLR